MDDAEMAELRRRIETSRQQIEASIMEIKACAEHLQTLLRPVPPELLN